MNLKQKKAFIKIIVASVIFVLLNVVNSYIADEELKSKSFYKF